MLDRLNKIKKDNQGFTIIEVLIVLAIAGLIMLIVFLAVPALQRNNRNTQRNNDAARIAGAVNECVGNNNGKLDQCDDFGELDPAYITMADNQQLINNGEETVNGANIVTGQECDADGAGYSASTSTRTFVVAYQVETSNGEVDRCISS